MHITIAPSTAANEDQGKRYARRHELETAQITIPGGGLPAQYTEHLHTLTTSGETEKWRARESLNETRETTSRILVLVYLERLPRESSYVPASRDYLENLCTRLP